MALVSLVLNLIGRQRLAGLAVSGALALPLTGLGQAPLRTDSAAAPQVPTALTSSPGNFPADSAARRKRRLRLLVGGSVLGYGTVYAGLATSWYTGARVPLHWFNDLPEWQQLDKCGHFWGAFQESRGAVDMLRWAGLSEKKAIWYGSFVGFALQSPIEYFDGQDPEYGASATDLAANFLGSAGLLAQQLAWHDVRIMPKWSFHLTSYAKMRPNVLGSTVPERLLKDYNGQTYWLCADVGAFLKPGNRWPRWLQPAFGYGGQDMVYNDDGTNAARGLRPYRQFYLSLDVDLRRIPTHSVLLKRVFYTLSIFHLPAPALEYNPRNGFGFHGLYM
ncbi:DUF2279 domain-containing protein [Hymenobacter negativus]|uniref:DUF2279 domain-containing protein n=1 Tax=Hymenobacter negativus TaxID=2795026 RepID=A0ABS0Q3X7_9BACT|nr:DUF2279 domain-containing protein [Hymenobacter negativus]MBH8557354.1 DUF2279 domain-containing protein [Hymenobacter negativus]